MANAPRSTNSPDNSDEWPYASNKWLDEWLKNHSPNKYSQPPSGFGAQKQPDFFWANNHPPTGIPEQSKLSDANAARVRFAELEQRYNQLDKQMNAQLLASQQKISGLEQTVTEETKKLKTRSKKVSEKLESLEQNVKNDKLQAIQILALFVAFFTFVSVEFQLFAIVKDAYTVLSLSLILLGALLIFVCLTHLGVGYIRQSLSFGQWVQRAWRESAFAIGMLAVVLLGGGVWLGAIAHEHVQDRKQRQVAACTELSKEIQTSLSKAKRPAATTFLQDRYKNECANIWAE